MIGIFLIIAGVIVLGIGIYLFIRSTKKDISQPINEKEKKGTTFNSNVENTHNKAELYNLIKLAAADGVLTEKERAIIFQKAYKLKIDPKLVKEKIKSELEKVKDPETKLIDKMKEKGDMFEGFVASKFNKKNFKLIEWAGDKYYNGVFAETTLHPDLKFRFKTIGVEQEFSIECKYRSHFTGECIEWALEKQMQNYRQYQKEQEIPVFVAIGVGGKPNNPDELFLIPLKHIEENILHQSMLKKYKKRNFKTHDIYFNHVEKKLW